MQLKVIYNVVNGRPPETNVRGSIAKTLQTLHDRGWMDKDGNITEAGKQAAGLILKEVPMPPHLVDLLHPRFAKPAFRKQGPRGPRS